MNNDMLIHYFRNNSILVQHVTLVLDSFTQWMGMIYDCTYHLTVH